MTAIVLIMAGCGGGAPGYEKGAGPELIYIVDLCYVNSDYLATGDEDLSAVRYYQRHNMYALKGKQYLTLLDVALRGNELGIEGVDTMITDKIQFNSVEVKEGTAFVDIAGKNLSGSSLEEGLLISQIVNSLTGSFYEVENVQFLIDGKSAESLMGHYSIEGPFETGIYVPGSMEGGT